MFKNKTVTIILIILGLVSMVIFTMLLFCAIMAAISVPRFQKLTQEAQVSIANSIEQSLQTAAAIYVAQQRKPPKKFSDFVILKGHAYGQYTMTFNNINAQISEPSEQKDLDTNKLEIDFKNSHVKATYYLNGTDVKAEIEE